MTLYGHSPSTWQVETHMLGAGKQGVEVLVTTSGTGLPRAAALFRPPGERQAEASPKFSRINSPTTLRKPCAPMVTMTTNQEFPR